jgi:surface antigen
MSDCESYARPRPWTSLRGGAALCWLAAALGLGGCATSIPLPAFISPDDVTGSIRAPISPLSSALDAEDWRRAKSALAVALDPQGNGAPVTWDNPASGAKGVFKPLAQAYAQDGLIGGKVPARQVTGLGCRDKAGEWEVSQVRPVKAS